MFNRYRLLAMATFLLNSLVACAPQTIGPAKGSEDMSACFDCPNDMNPPFAADLSTIETLPDLGPRCIDVGATKGSAWACSFRTGPSISPNSVCKLLDKTPCATTSLANLPMINKIPGFWLFDIQGDLSASTCTKAVGSNNIVFFGAGMSLGLPGISQSGFTCMSLDHYEISVQSNYSCPTNFIDECQLNNLAEGFVCC